MARVRQHGGRREGTPGRAYTNRSDLNQNRQPVTAAPNQPYGVRGAQEAAQRAVPLPAPPPVQAPPPLASGPAPGSFGALNRPTELPDEPLTAGLPIGAGAGPEALAGMAALSRSDELVARLRGLYQAYPSDDLERLLSYAESRAGG